jgi:hypothetical protein
MKEMMQKVVKLSITVLLFSSCHMGKELVSVSENSEMPNWNVETLNQKAIDHLDSTKWDLPLFKQDIETYEKYEEVFQSYPLNKSPFPVAEYDYAVSYLPFTIEQEGTLIKGVKIGECEDPDCENITAKLTLLVVTNDKEAEELTLVDSRNFPYLTAQGFFKVLNKEFDWVFSASPDGFSSLLLNMKFFDLRFGETVVIYPQADNSFFYDQIKDSPNNYESFEKFKTTILTLESIQERLKSAKNIR